MKAWSQAIYKFLSSPKFFWIVLGVFVFQASWIALSALYPMAFDEAYHFETTSIYAEQWSPFLSEHPDNAEGLAAVHRYPSYLFHYLMSFPLRIAQMATDSETAQIIFLRFLNIGMVAGGLVLFRRLFKKVGVSSALSSVGILFFTLIPIVPLLAAHINYDNLLLLLIPWMLLLIHGIFTQLKRQDLPLQSLLALGILVLISGIVKYAMLPILLVMTLFVAALLVRYMRNLPISEVRAKTRSSWQSMRKSMRIALPLLFAISGILAFERYGLNLIEYGALVPACDDVISYEECLEFGPFARNQAYLADVDPEFRPSRLEHTQTWLGGMWYRTLFMINGDVAEDRYQNYPPLPIMAVGFSLIFLLGSMAIIRYWRYLFWGKPFNLMLISIVAFYSAILLHNNYSSYVEYGRTAALNGRYLLLVFPMLIMLMSLAVSKLLAGRDNLKLAGFAIGLVMILQGGGLVSFIVQSSDTWYWPEPVVQSANEAAQSAIKPLVYGSQERHLEFIPH